MNKLPQRQVHLDFHTCENIKNIGSMFDKEQFKACLKKGHINSITVFAKCHHGWGYFKSETIPMHPELDFDLLSKMLEACKEANIEAPIYISGGLDENYIKNHPEHMRMSKRDLPPLTIAEKDGNLYTTDSAGYHQICMNTPYLDLLCSQVKEVVQKFNPCGIFLDIVSPRICFCDYCKKEALKLGMDIEDDKTFETLAEITYKKYYEAINNTARAIDPNIRIFHNGGHIKNGRRDLAYANTHLEIESLPTGGWGYDHFPKSVKYAQMLDMEYLGMTGKFHSMWGDFGGFKHPNALKYEVALSIAHGAKCSVGDQMHPYGFLDEATYELIGSAYAEAEGIEKYCYNISPIADIAMLSCESISSKANIAEDVGLTRMLLQGKYLFNIIDSESDFSVYKLIILPDSLQVVGDLLQKLREYVKNGGKLLCSGMSGVGSDNNFLFDFGAKFKGAVEYSPAYYHPSYDALGLSSTTYVTFGQMFDIEQTDRSAKVLGYSRYPFFNRAPEHFCSHKHTPFIPEDRAPAVILGKDGGYIAWKIFGEFKEIGSIILKDTFIRVVDELLGESKTLKTNLGSAGIVSLNEQIKENRFVLHALYALPQLRGKNIEVIEDLPTVYDTSFEIKLDKKITSIYDARSGEKLDFSIENGICKFVIKEFTCSKVLVLEY